MNELTSTSGALTIEQQDAYRLDYEIKAEAKNIVSGICRIGKCLKEIKDRRLYLQLGSDSLEDYAEKAVGLKGRAAYNYISAFETYGEEGLEKYGTLGITKLAALAQLNDADRNEVLESGKAEELSTRELQEEIKRLKHSNEQLTFELEETASKSSDIDKLKNENEKLKLALEEERSTKILPAPVMSEAEKEEIRRNIKAEEEARHAKEIKEAEAEAVAKTEKAMKEKLTAEKKKALLSAEENKNLKAELETLRAEKSKLQANAQKTPPSDKKELLKFLCKDIIDKFNSVGKIITELPEEEKEGCIRAVKTVAEQIGLIAERI